ncbi:MAG: VOC family protein [Bacillota bacterium]
MAQLFKRIDTVFFPVRNLEAAVSWYTETLGLSLRWKVEGYACLNLAETPLTLVERGDAFTPVTHATFNFYAADIDGVYNHLKAAGVVVDPAIADPPGVRYFGFQDPDGNRLEVCWWPEK